MEMERQDFSPTRGYSSTRDSKVGWKQQEEVSSLA